MRSTDFAESTAQCHILSAGKMGPNNSIQWTAGATLD